MDPIDERVSGNSDPVIVGQLEWGPNRVLMTISLQEAIAGGGGSSFLSPLSRRHHH